MTTATILRKNTVLISFASNIPSEVQSKGMMEFEKILRRMTGMEIEVFKEVMGDDSKLRVQMTPEERNKL